MRIIDYYKDLLTCKDSEFLDDYLSVPSMQRIKGIGYFCGMDYASKRIYNFKEYITRYDHSLTTALLSYKLSKDKKTAIAALFHDVGTPAFSHVIDYMNKDYKNQESTEEYTEKIIKNDKELVKLLRRDNIDESEIIEFKKYSIVDNNRPKLCADRLDGIILTGSLWTKDIDKQFIKDVLDNLKIYINEDNEEEIGLNNLAVANKLVIANENIDKYCHSKEDNYMMELLANITRSAINEKIINYDDLYRIDERKLFEIFEQNGTIELKRNLNKFHNIRKEEIDDIKLPFIKKRTINPLVEGRRFL